MKHQPNKRIAMLAEGSIGKTLFAMAAPAITGMVVIAVYNVVDTIFVSLLRDTTAIAATGIVFPLFQLIGAVGLTFGMGAASVISRRLGEHRREDAQATGTTAFYTAVAVGLLLSLSGALFIRPLLILFGATDTILDTAILYGKIIIGGSFFQVINMTLNNLLRSEGAALHSSTGQILGALLNILLDPIFIFLFDMGIAGAATATIVSQACATLFLLSYYLRGKGELNPLHITCCRFSRRMYRDIMTLGLPTFVRQIMGSVAFAILNNAAGNFGDSAIAAFSITFRIFMLLLMALIGLSQGLQPLAGYNFGARQLDRVKAAVKLSFRISIGAGVVFGIIGFIFAPNIMRFFAPQDQEVITRGIMAMRFISISLIPTGLVIMFGGTFQALGDGRSALILAIGQQGGFLIPLLLILPRILGVAGVYLAQPAGFILTFLIGALLMGRAWRKQLSPDLNKPSDPAPSDA